jgi:hypothetical protein
MAEERNVTELNVSDVLKAAPPTMLVYVVRVRLKGGKRETYHVNHTEAMTYDEIAAIVRSEKKDVELLLVGFPIRGQPPTIELETA